MEKLIVVGMRYQNTTAVDYIVKAVKKSEKVPVTLVVESGGILYGKSLAVYYGSSRVGFIRNADLPEAFESCLNYGYIVRSCQANYWILEGRQLYAKPPSYQQDYNIEKIQHEYPNALSNQVYTPQELKDKQHPINSTKDEKKMINTNSMRDSFFREVKNVAIDIQSGKFGVVTPEGISVFDNGGISVNPIADFGVKVPAFAMRVPVADLKAGDIIVGGSEPTFFVGLIKEGGYEVVNMSGEHKVIGTVSNMFFGKNSVLAVKNMFGEGTNPMMMAMMMGDSKEGFDMKTFALMNMMGGSANKEGGGMDQNMLMMMLMLMDK